MCIHILHGRARVCIIYMGGNAILENFAATLQSASAYRQAVPTIRVYVYGCELSLSLFLVYDLLMEIAKLTLTLTTRGLHT